MEIITILWIPLLAIPFASSVIAFPLRSRRALEWLSISVMIVLTCIYGATLASFLASGSRPLELWSYGIKGLKGPLISFVYDSFSAVLLGISILVGLAIMVFSRGYISPENREHPILEGFSRYYGLLMLFVGSMIGVALAGDWVTLLVFYELTGICSCFLIGFYGTPQSVRASFLAFIVTHVGSTSLAAATMITYLYTHSVSFSAIASLAPSTLALVGILILVAALAKSAQLPLYLWLPEAMVAPATVSAYLHAAAMVKVGVFTFIRFCQYLVSAGLTSYVVAWVALVLALATMFFGAFNYYRQVMLKRLLAWSTIVQLSVMMLALAISLLQKAPTAVYVAAYHMWNHSFAKALLFLTVGALAYATGRSDIDAMNGVARVRNLAPLAYLWIIGGLAISAIPPFGCFFSKIALLITGIRGPLAATIACVLALLEGYLLTLPAFLRIGLRSVRGRPSPKLLESIPIPRSALATLISLAIASTVSGFLTPLKIPW